MQQHFGTFRHQKRALSTQILVYLFCLIFGSRGVVVRDGERPSSPSELFSLDTLAIPDTAVTYTEHQFRSKWSRISSLRKTSPHAPDLTVVLLNWSRLPNLVLQASVYCDPSLEDIVQDVFVWNNRPDLNLTYESHFSETGCGSNKLRIFNSPANLYFRARFLGCTQSHSRYCFLQDDDYITRPQILRNIYNSFSRLASDPHAISPIILLPPHDHLESDLLEISIPYSKGFIKTTFACLGHGTFLFRSQAVSFLTLIDDLSLSGEELNIADNYFTLLSGHLPDTWLTHTIELADDTVSPFTVGAEGNLRNWRHIERAMVYLDKLIAREDIPPPKSHFRPFLRGLSRTYTAPCIQDPCVITSNIKMVPTTLSHIWALETQMRTLQSERLANLSQDVIRWYTRHTLSHAVDGDSRTSFRSIGSAKSGDMISLKLLQWYNSTESIEVVWLVDSGTASLLHAADLEISSGSNVWHTLEEYSITCFPTRSLSVPIEINIDPPSILSIADAQRYVKVSPTALDTTFPGSHLLECHAPIGYQGDYPEELRIKLRSDLAETWSIYEIWFRINTEL